MTTWATDVSGWLESAGVDFETCGGPDGEVQGWKVIFPPTPKHGGIIVEVRIGPAGLLLSVPIYLPSEYAADRYGAFLQMNGRNALAHVCMVGGAQLAVVGHVYFERLSPEELGVNIAAVRDAAREVLTCEPWVAPLDVDAGATPSGTGGPGSSKGGLLS